MTACFAVAGLAGTSIAGLRCTVLVAGTEGVRVERDEDASLRDALHRVRAIIGSRARKNTVARSAVHYDISIALTHRLRTIVR